MPEIDPWLLDPLQTGDEFGTPTLYYIWGLMLSGGDEQKAADLLEKVIGNSIAPAIRAMSADQVVVPLDVISMIELASAARPSREAIEAARTGEWWHGPIAGEILWTTLCADFHVPVSASVRKSIELIKIRNVDRGLPTSKSTITAAWSTFKPVSHLWAAWNIWPIVSKPITDAIVEAIIVDLKVDEQMAELIREEESEEPLALTDPDALRSFLALAEHLRADAEGHYSHGQRRRNSPMLAKDEAWRLPSSDGLPTVSFSYPGFPEDEMKTLLGF